MVVVDRAVQKKLHVLELDGEPWNLGVPKSHWQLSRSVEVREPEHNVGNKSTLRLSAFTPILPSGTYLKKTQKTPCCVKPRLALDGTLAHSHDRPESDLQRDPSIRSHLL